MIKYKELKTIFKHYQVHGRIITVCVKEFEGSLDSIKINGSSFVFTNTYIECLYHTVTVGISICNPTDDPNDSFGRTIAEGRADKALEKENEYMYIVGYLNKTPQSKNKFVLEQFADSAYFHFKHNPELYIHNFNKNNK